MKKICILFITGIIFPVSVLASVEYIDIEDTPIVEHGVLQQAEEQSNVIQKADPKIVILNNQNQKTTQKYQQAQMYQQPAIRVEGIPVSETYAVKLRNSRKKAEIQTEQKIAERLESARLMDEQKRLSQFFGQKIAKKSVLVTDKYIVSENPEKKYAASITKTKNTDKSYLGIHGGQPSNLTPLQSNNVTSYGSVGISLGAFDNSGFIVESSFFYTEHTISSSNPYQNNQHNLNNLYGTELDQLTGTLSLKYTPLLGRFQPYVGIALSYNYWLEDNNVSNYNNCYEFSYSYCRNSKANFDSIDLGSNIGADFTLNHKLSIGFNMLINILNLRNNRLLSDYNYNYYESQPVNFEETNWLIASVNAKVYF